MNLSEFEKFIGTSTPTLIDFYASWCGPCRMQAPIIDFLKKEVGDLASVIKVDIDTDLGKKLIETYHVKVLPTLLLFKKGKLVLREIGILHEDKFQEVLDAVS